MRPGKNFWEKTYLVTIVLVLECIGKNILLCMLSLLQVVAGKATYKPKITSHISFAFFRKTNLTITHAYIVKIERGQIQ